MQRIRSYSSDHKPTFQEWVVNRYGVSCSEMYANFKATGSGKEYQKAMAFLRLKYKEDMKYREALLAANPFEHKEDK